MAGSVRAECTVGRFVSLRRMSLPTSGPDQELRRLWVGTYPEAGIGTPAGQGEGIWAVDLDLAGRRLGEPRLVVTSPAASFLAEHRSGRVLYALSETAPGELRAVPLDDAGRPGPPVVVPSGGDGPCHLLVTEVAVYVAHYGDGALAVHRVGPDGSFVDDGPAQVHPAPGRAPDARSHAHFAALAPGGTHLLVCDLGLDVLRRYRVGPDGLLTDDGVAARLPRGTGPRHLAFGPGDLVHVVGELDATLTTLRWDRASAEATVVAVVDLAPEIGGPRERAYPAHVVRDHDGVHVSVRGPDELVTVPHAAACGGEGVLRRRAVSGSWPRHFAAVAGLFVVAAERSHQLVLLGPDGAVADVTRVPSAACVVASAPSNLPR